MYSLSPNSPGHCYHTSLLVFILAHFTLHALPEFTPEISSRVTFYMQHRAPAEYRAAPFCTYQHTTNSSNSQTQVVPGKQSTKVTVLRRELKKLEYHCRVPRCVENSGAYIGMWWYSNFQKSGAKRDRESNRLKVRIIRRLHSFGILYLVLPIHRIPVFCTSLREVMTN